MHDQKLAVEYRPLASLKPNKRNARTHSKRQIKAIAQSIETSGFNNPILIDQENVIIAGHGRFAAASLLGLEKVPAILISNLSEAQKRAYILADNALAERAGWDREMLAVELGELAIMLPEMGLSIEFDRFRNRRDRWDPPRR